MTSNKHKTGYAEKVIRFLPRKVARDMAQLCLQGWSFKYIPPARQQVGDCWRAFHNGRAYTIGVSLELLIANCKARQAHIDTLQVARLVVEARRQ